MEMRWLERPEQSHVFLAEGCSVTGHTETDRRHGSTARRVDGYPERPSGRRDRGIAASRLDGHSLPDAVSLQNLDRVWQPQGCRVGLVGSVGPVALVLHLPEIAFEPDHNLATRSGVRDRMHVDERLMR